ncbi:hypothetical protein KAI56_01900 [Candidatus Parcubacteria bacterium]|nr:hypothetical protein [Candidatus Parcubacteria bacterium]
MNDIFSKLNSLKSIEPSESWVVDTKKEVLSEAPVFERKGILERLTVAVDSRLRGNDKGSFNFQDLFQNLSFKRLMVPAFSLVFMLSAGIFTLGASGSSLPGESLYLVKMINEDIALAVAPENKKATIEMEHAGRRLEEMAEISKKTSDVEQQKKIGQLMERFEEKIESANDNLTKIDKSVEKRKIAKVINIQSEKYTEVLAKTTEDLPAVVKDEILEEVAKAINSSEKIYSTSLAVIIEDEEDEEIVDEAVDETNEEDEEVGEEITDTEEDAEEDPLVSDGDNDSEEGNVKGDEDENSQLDPADDVNGEDLADEDADKNEDAGEAISDETEKEAIKIEDAEEVEENL